MTRKKRGETVRHVVCDMRDVKETETDKWIFYITECHACVICALKMDYDRVVLYACACARARAYACICRHT